MKLCIEGDIYFVPKFHILESGTEKLSFYTGLNRSVPVRCSHCRRLLPRTVAHDSPARLRSVRPRVSTRTPSNLAAMAAPRRILQPWPPPALRCCRLNQALIASQADTLANLRRHATMCPCASGCSTRSLARCCYSWFSPRVHNPHLADPSSVPIDACSRGAGSD
jgi:hypothetical protein